LRQQLKLSVDFSLLPFVHDHVPLGQGGMKGIGLGLSLTS
jgi:hypothetical protein